MLSFPHWRETLHFLVKLQKWGEKSNQWPFRTNKRSQQLQAESRAACSTAGSISWFIMLPASFHNKLCGWYGQHELNHVHMLHVMYFVCAVCQTAVSNTEFPDHCSMEWLSSRLGLSAIIPQTAAGYSILSKFHFLCASAIATQQRSAVGFLLFCKYKIDTHTHTRNGIHCTIEALVPVQIYLFILGCLLTWLKQSCNYLYEELLVSEVFYMQTYVIQWPQNASSLGCCSQDISFMLGSYRH